MSIYVFDLDGTLCSDTKGDYQAAKPHVNRIKVVNTLYSEGHYIVISTARGMGSSKNNREFAENTWLAITSEQLNKCGILHHELHLGKPAGDFYIDDKAISDSDFFTK